MPVREVPLALEHRVTGSLRTAHEALMAAREEGALLTVPHQVGETVEAGAVIAELDSRRLKAQEAEFLASIARANADVQQQKALVAFAEEDLLAMEAALAKNAVAEQKVRQARTEVDVAKARLRASEAAVTNMESQLTSLRVRLEDVVVRAPFRGRVLERMAEPGEWIRPGEPILRIASAGVLEAWLDVPERFARDLFGALPTPVVRLEPGEHTVPSQRARIMPTVHPTARTFALILDVADMGGALLPGMSVSALVPMGPPSPRLVVSGNALVRRPGQVFLFRVTEKSGSTFAEQVPVQVVFEHQDGSVVTGGLKPNDLVVTEGNERLRDGAPILVLRDLTENSPAKGESGR